MDDLTKEDRHFIIEQLVVREIVLKDIMLERATRGDTQGVSNASKALDKIKNIIKKLA